VKRRFETVHRPLDWAVLLSDIGKHIKYADVAEIAGRSRASITSIANDLHEAPEEWNKAFALIDLWIRLGNTNLPVK